MIDQVLEETADDAEALGCLDEMRRCRTIVGAGTSADAQMAVFENARQDRRPRQCAQRRHRLARGRDAAIVPLPFAPAARSAPRGRGRGHRPRRARAARTASASAPLRANASGASMSSGASGPIRPSSKAPSRLLRRELRVLLRQMTAVDRGAIRASISAARSPAITAGRTASVSVSTGSAITAQASLRWRKARAAKVAIAAASADSGPGAASAARRTASISRPATLSTSAPTSSILPGNSDRRCRQRRRRAPRPARSGSPPCRLTPRRPAPHRRWRRGGR